MENLLTVDNLSVSYGDQNILEHFSFSLEKGDALAVIGPNGAGKTTLFRALIGAIPYRGTIQWSRGTKIGYVPQTISFEKDLPLTVREFFLLHSEPRHRASLHKSLEESLQHVHLSKDFLDRRFMRLSAGEAQRVLIAWALLDTPDVLLFDEPTANVDVAGQETIYELLHQLQDLHGITLVLISHDLSIVYRYATKVICINRTMICFGTPHDVLTTQELEKLYSGGKTFYHHMHQSDIH